MAAIKINIDDSLLGEIKEVAGTLGMTADEAFAQMAQWYIGDLRQMAGAADEISEEEMMALLFGDAYKVKLREAGRGGGKIIEFPKQQEKPL